MAAVPAPSRALTALGHVVGDATGRLSGDERAALELRESDGMRYAGIASALGRDPDDVAPLLVGARLHLHAGLRGRPVPGPAGADCERARPLIAARQDGELTDPAEGAWLSAHSKGCEACRATRLAMREATVAFRGAARATGPAAALAPPRSSGSTQGQHPAQLPPAPRALPAAAGAAAEATALPGPAPAAVPAPEPARAPRTRRTPGPRSTARPRRAAAALATVLGVLAAAFAVVSFAGGGEPERTVTSPATPAIAAPAQTTAPEPTADAAAAAERRRRRAAAERRRRRAAAERRRERAEASPTPAATRAATEPTPSPDGDERRDSGDDTDRPSGRRPAAPAPGDTQTETETEAGGLGAPQPGATPGGVTDVCNEESPDCESG